MAKGKKITETERNEWKQKRRNNSHNNTKINKQSAGGQRKK